jgi:hypothetical protein
VAKTTKSGGFGPTRFAFVFMLTAEKPADQRGGEQSGPFRIILFSENVLSSLQGVSL